MDLRRRLARAPPLSDECLGSLRVGKRGKSHVRLVSRWRRKENMVVGVIESLFFGNTSMQKEANPY